MAASTKCWFRMRLGLRNKMIKKKIYIILKVSVFIIISTYFNQIHAQKNTVYRKEIENIEKYNIREINFIDSEDNTLLSGTLFLLKLNIQKL